MASQDKLDEAYMRCAFALSKLSHAQRKKVGAVLVSAQGGIIAEGVNGTPSGFENFCEDVDVAQHDLHHNMDRNEYYCSKCDEWIHRDFTVGYYDLNPRKFHEVRTSVTKPEVLHAESNAIAKVARSTNTSIGSTLYCTLSPCFECAKLIIQAGVVRVVYSEEYPYAGRTGPVPLPGLDLLKKAKIRIDCLPLHSQYVKDEKTN